MKENCHWCENRSYTTCKDCKEASNFKSSKTYEEWKRERKAKGKEKQK